MSFSKTKHYEVKKVPDDSSLMDDFQFDFCKFNFIVAGEYHDLPENSSVFFSMVRALKKSNCLNEIVFELPLTYEPFFNAYIISDDQDSLELLGKIGSQLKGQLNFLKEFNKELKNEDKLRVRCVDAELEFSTPLRYFIKILTDSNIKALGIEYLNEVQFKGRNNQNQHKHIIEQLINDFQNNDEKFKSVLSPESYKKCVNLIKGINLGAGYNFREGLVTIITPEKIKQDSIFLINRELYIYDNILELFKNSNKNRYGHFGKIHTYLNKEVKTREIQKWNSFTSLFNSISYTGSIKICSINIFYRRFFNEDKDIYKGLSSNSTIIQSSKKNTPLLFNVFSNENPIYDPLKNHHFLIYR